LHFLPVKIDARKIDAGSDLGGLPFQDLAAAGGQRLGDLGDALGGGIEDADFDYSRLGQMQEEAHPLVGGVGESDGEGAAQIHVG
jgi:hypothetical protein